MGLEAVAARWRSEQYAGEVAEEFEQLRTEKRAAAVDEHAGDVPARVPLNERSAKIMAGAAWKILDVLVCKFISRDLKLKPDESAELVTASVPVVQLYVPELPGGDLLTHPAAALAVVAGTIYGAKLIAPASQTVDAKVEVQRFEKKKEPPAPPAPKSAPQAKSTGGGAAAVAAAGSNSAADVEYLKEIADAAT